MHWLKDNVYLASWLAIPVALIGMVYQNRGKTSAEVDWNRSLLYIAFLVALAAAFTPIFDTSARTTAGLLVSMLIPFLIIDRKPR
ncbi:hypothetical protein GCM10011507_20760 [Edaphobacter acidisoli]|uniref:Uncharacterized protein n=1 Tax=Edaphobacter acidisoli TaxID=2040573 RepID=A0A916W633_9BACT|nr:hypothetical protein [Edaphobacter acidisoli]GGA69117.1 hypothetical protein GCM10011507_20760 [Edaphobacter acidisoli]